MSESVRAAREAAAFSARLAELANDAASEREPNAAYYARVVAAMEGQGWVNPDGVGILWYHPDILAGDGTPGWMGHQSALDIATAWEHMPERRPKAREKP